MPFFRRAHRLPAPCFCSVQDINEFPLVPALRCASTRPRYVSMALILLLLCLRLLLCGPFDPAIVQIVINMPVRQKISHASIVPIPPACLGMGLGCAGSAGFMGGKFMSDTVQSRQAFLCSVAYDKSTKSVSHVRPPSFPAVQPKIADQPFFVAPVLFDLHPAL